MYRPPSLQTLRALEAAARLRSFSRAAKELGVTHGAISHRVREIEERMGTPMFERRGNTMEPTSAANQMLAVIRQALELIGSVFPHPAASGTQTLRIGILPSFARWLVPRLDEFHSAHPDIAVSLDARIEVSDFTAARLDAAIRYGQGSWPGLASERLMTDPLFPACSPAYKQRMKIQGIADFMRCRLLRNSWQPWTPWFQAVGLKMPEPSDSMPFDDSGLMMDAAVAGHGIGLVRRVVSYDAVRAGELVRLHPMDFPFSGYYHYAHRPGASESSPAVSSFGQWLAARLLEDFPEPSDDVR
jgi:LysR family glycine cleavage system transcriptional activator